MNSEVRRIAEKDETNHEISRGKIWEFTVDEFLDSI